MAITDPQSILFANQKVRPLSDQISQFYYRAKSVLQQYNSTALLTTITNDSSVVMDGSATDGRTVLTGQDIVTMLSLCQGIVTNFEASANLQLNQITKPAVNKIS